MTHMPLTFPLFSLKKNENYRIDFLIVKKIFPWNSHACTYYAIFRSNINGGEQNNTLIFCKRSTGAKNVFIERKLIEETTSHKL